ncbi:MAG: hypothetical protein WCL16_10835 [bacterium]
MVAGFASGGRPVAGWYPPSDGDPGMAFVLVQNPASTEYDGMPCSATGTVDYELPPAATFALRTDRRTTA